MEKCKFCQGELEENSTVCPVCGRDNAEEVAEEAEVTAAETAEPAEIAEIEAAAEPVEAAPVVAGNSRKTIFGLVAVIVVLAAALVAVLWMGMKKTDAPAQGETTVQEETTEPTEAPTIPADGNPEDVTCKGTYTAADDAVVAAGDSVVARFGDYTLTNGELQIYYWMEFRQFLTNYGAYLSYFGLDPNQPLDTQPCSVQEGLTWQQFFLSEALDSWYNFRSMAAEAEQTGFTLTDAYQKELDALDDDMAASAEAGGFENAGALLAFNMGAGATPENYRKYAEVFYNANGYYEEVYSGFQPTDAEVEAYFEEHAETFAENGVTKDSCVVDVRHILIQPKADEGAEDTGTYTDEQWAAGETEAKRILALWQDGEQTEEQFSELANTYSEDPGSNTNGGLYEDVSVGRMVQEFNDWCFDPARQPGDTDIVRTSYGFHVMYFVESTPIWQDYAREDYLRGQAQSFVEGIMGKYTLDVDYAAIKLGYVDVAAASGQQ